MPEIRTAPILTTFRHSFPAESEFYQPGTLGAFPQQGLTWAGKITQLQITTNCRQTNRINIVAVDMEMDEIELIREFNISRQTSPINVIPVLTPLESFAVASDIALKIAIIFPERIQTDEFITISGYAVETSLGDVPISEIEVLNDWFKYLY